MTATSIEWTDRVWNPVTGCTKVSAGCKHCYAERFAGRKMGEWAERPFSEVMTHPNRLDAPGKWLKPQKVFVNSMSDLFHEDVPFEFIHDVFNTMMRASWHTFQVCTKRPRRMLGYFEWCKEGMHERGLDQWWEGVDASPNIWLGVSVENQAAADERIPLLLQCPAAVRFLSCEPLLGGVEIFSQQTGELLYHCANDYEPGSIDWVIAGGESGPGARPMHPDWVRSIRDQCAAANVPFFFKQWGEWGPGENCPAQTKTERTATFFNKEWSFSTATTKESESTRHEDVPDLFRVGKKKSGRLLDGVKHNSFPVVQP